MSCNVNNSNCTIKKKRAWRHLWKNLWQSYNSL